MCEKETFYIRKNSEQINAFKVILSIKVMKNQEGQIKDM
jgi:hypothetical protein